VGSFTTVDPGQAWPMRRPIKLAMGTSVAGFIVTVITVTVKSAIVYGMPEAARPRTDETPTEWTVDELARLVELPVRTLREYQTLGIVSAPRREGRVGFYGLSHLRRLELIARLRSRGYSLAGISDLLGNWRSGADLGEVLGLEPDQLVHVDEPGAPATLEQLGTLLPAMARDDLDRLVAVGVIERSGPDRFCVPSPSLLQLAIEAQAAGLHFDETIDLLDAIRRAADTVADQVVSQITKLAPGNDAERTVAFLQRGRGLLGHGVGRLTLHRIGRRLGIADEAHLDDTLSAIAGQKEKPK
jgi:DNA-binding transcriptional MerR regulator